MRPDEHDELGLVDKHKLRPHNDLRQYENKLGRPDVNKLRIDMDELRASANKLCPYKHELMPEERVCDQM